jgi:triphosphoribosyl-dephospho-CoA synthase
MSSLALWAQTACLWEVTAGKAGDTNPRHDLDTLHYVDFLLSTAAIAPVLGTADTRPVGATVLEAVQAMRQTVGKNPHLGTILLLAPLATVPLEADLRGGVIRVLDDLTVEDARAVYQAIRLAQPSGLGRASEQDVATEPTQTLRAVMTLAADRDLVARQYANGFHEVFDEAVPALQHGMAKTGSLEEAILFCQLSLLANHPDSLIARKRGLGEATEASRRAREVLQQAWPKCDTAWRGLDAWLRAERGRNPGTTADLIATVLFVALRTGILTVPPALPWSLTATSA